jgi:wyosine [tRNA(Phe)-imidazoG37] synthetase (radical SAM superfamily)
MEYDIKKITFKNLSYVQDIVNTIAKEHHCSISQKPFLITKKTINKSVLKSLRRYVSSINKILQKKQIPIKLEIAQELLSGLNLLDEARKEYDPDILIRLLGILCNYAFVGPTTIHLDLTNNCNTNCIYCWWHSPYCENRKTDTYATWRKQKIEKETVMTFLKDAKSLGVLDILIAGAGEPLLYPYIQEVIRTIKQLDIHSNLFTNGLLLTPKNSKLAIDNGLDMVSLTLSATNPETFKKNYPNGTEQSFAKIVENIRFFNQYKEEKNASSTILLCFVINNTNYKECADYIQFAKSLGIKHVRFQMMDFVEGTKQFILSEEQLTELKKILTLAKNIAKANWIRVDENIDFQEECITTDGTWSATTQEDYCFAGWYFTRLWVDKKISFCCSNKYINSLEEQTYPEIWNSNRYRHARMTAVQYNEKSSFRCTEGQKLIGPECRQCGNYEFNERALRLLKKTRLINYLSIPTTNNS